MKGSFDVQDYEFRFEKDSFLFDNAGFGYLVASQSMSTLMNLMKEESFIPSPRDIESFVMACIHKKWQAGL